MNNLRRALLFLLLVPCWIIGWHGAGDIGMYHAVAGYAHQHEFARIYGINAGVGHFFYGPISLVFFYWMAFLSYEKVRIAWILINTAAYCGFWSGLLRLFPSLKKNIWLFLFVWVSSIKAIHASFQSHNVQLVIAALLVWGEWARSRQAPYIQFLAGWGSVLTGYVKVFPFFMTVYGFLLGSRLTRLGIWAAGVAGLVLPLFWFGLNDGFRLYGSFLGNLGNFHDYAPLTKDAVTLSLPSLIATWFSGAIGIEASLWIAKGLGGMIAFLFMGLAWQSRNLDHLRIPIFSLALALMALINSSTRPDYFIFFVPAFTALGEMIIERSAGKIHLVFLCIALALIDFICEWTLGSRELNHQLELLRLPVVGMIVLCGTLAHAIVLQIKKTEAARGYSVLQTV